MSLDATTKRQLVEARERITAQLGELEYRATSKGCWRRRDARDHGDIYDILNNELGEINEILGLDRAEKT